MSPGHWIAAPLLRKNHKGHTVPCLPGLHYCHTHLTLLPRDLWSCFPLISQMMLFLTLFLFFVCKFWLHLSVCGILDWTQVRGSKKIINTLFRFVITFLPGSKHLLITWLHSPSTVILEPKKIKFITTSTFSPFKQKENTARQWWDQMLWS